MAHRPPFRYVYSSGRTDAGLTVPCPSVLSCLHPMHDVHVSEIFNVEKTRQRRGDDQENSHIVHGEDITALR